MFRLCPKCRAKLRPITYKAHGIIRHYFKCECGWTNKPQDLPEENKESENGEE